MEHARQSIHGIYSTIIRYGMTEELIMISEQKLYRYIGICLALILSTGFLEFDYKTYPEVAKLEGNLISQWVADTGPTKAEINVLTKLQDCEIDREFHGLSFRNCRLETGWPTRTYRENQTEVKAKASKILGEIRSTPAARPKNEEPPTAVPSIGLREIPEDVLEYMTYLHHIVIKDLQLKIYLANAVLLLLILTIVIKREFVGRSICYAFDFVCRKSREAVLTIHNKV